MQNLDENLQKIIKNAKILADSPAWQDEINSLPSGRIGFIYMAVEDALEEYASFLSFDGQNFNYDGPPIPDGLVKLKG